MNGIDGKVDVVGKKKTKGCGWGGNERRGMRRCKGMDQIERGFEVWVDCRDAIKEKKR